MRVLLLAATLMLAGLLGAVEPAPAQPAAGPAWEAQLKERVLAYWNARAKKDFGAEYDLLEPRVRARVSRDEYGRGRTVQYLAAQVETVERRGSFAKVGVRLLVKVVHPFLPGGSRTESSLLDDYWVLIQGVWYRTQEADLGAEVPWPMAPGSGS